MKSSSLTGSRRRNSKGIVDIQLQRVRRRLEAKGLFLRMTPEATALVADHGFDPVYGARPLKRAIQHDLLDPLSLKLLEGDFPEGTEIVVREKRRQTGLHQGEKITEKHACRRVAGSGQGRGVSCVPVYCSNGAERPRMESAHSYFFFSE